MSFTAITRRIEQGVFSHRLAVIALFGIATIAMLWPASQLRIDAGFTKLLPLNHPYMETFQRYRQAFGGSDRIVVALANRNGDMFTPEFFRALEEATDEIFFLPGVDRTRVFSLFTPNVRFTEVTERGIEGGDVVPSDFQPTEEGIARVRENILKAGVVGRLVANDFSGAIVSAELLEIDPNTGERLDYVEVARYLEERIRDRFSGEHAGRGTPGSGPELDVHIIGFAKVVGEVADGVARVAMFFVVTLLVTALIGYLYSQSMVLTFLLIACSLVAVIWQLGLLSLLGFGIDPMSILAPFLVFAIGVSHGVQMVSAVRAEILVGADGATAARRGFRRLLLPGSVALASDAIGFFAIMLIDIRIIQEMAITAGLGVAVIILTNLLLLPLLLSYVVYGESYAAKVAARAERLRPLWTSIARLASPRAALAVIGAACVLLAFGAWKGSQVAIGDLHRGVPELRSDSRYNIDSAAVSQHFSIGVDLLGVIAESFPEACTDYDVMSTIDRFAWRMRNVVGVQSVRALTDVAKLINSGWNEGSPKWRVLPRNRHALIESVAYIPTTTGLLNTDCSAMPVLVHTADHKAETIDRVVAAVKRFNAEHATEKLRFQLATGNVGVMAATNEEVRAAQFPVLLYVISAVTALCLLTFRSLAAALCIVLPLGLTSLLAYALMVLLEIGLKVTTLPVVALGVGIGVDYGIYLFSRLQSLLSHGRSLSEAYESALRSTGSGVVFTGLTLGAGVATWILAPLKFQADMGLLLTFMFLVNMLGAIFLMPALAGRLLWKEAAHSR